MLRILLMLLTVLFAEVTNGQPLNIEHFAKEAQYTSVKLSPDGKYLAATAPYNDQTVLVIIDRKTMKLSHTVKFFSNEHVDEYYWANNERLVFTRAIKFGRAEQPKTYGQIYAVNADGSKEMIVFGYQASSSRQLRPNFNNAPSFAHGEVLHLLPDDPKHILISARGMGSDYDAPVKIYRLNIYTLRKRMVTRTPFGNMNTLLTRSGDLFMAYGFDRKGHWRTFYYLKDKWQEVDQDSPIHGLTPVTYYPEKNQLLLLGNPEGGTEALFLFDRQSQALKQVFQDLKNDIHNYIRDPATQEIVGVELLPGKVTYHYLKPKHDFVKLHRGLTTAFPGQSIDITSQTSQSDELVVFVRSDKNPGDFYLYNQAKSTAQYLFSAKRWIDPQMMAERQPIQFNNRNGDTIHGYLTLPKKTAKEPKPYPLVVFVHGGPYGIRDTWFYDNDAQFLAYYGYAVLQVNFRGSGGYGEQFEEVAYQKQSTLIQEDIIDGTRWAQKRKQIDDNKVCIMGWSFGGYSALMAPLIEPELFHCSIAAAGVYDAVEQEEDADYANTESTAARAAVVYGVDERLLKSESPITYIDRLKTPVFIVHGGLDKRVPPEQAYILKKALDKHNKPYEWMFKKAEGHGFYNEQSRVEFYRRTLSFLSKYLK